MERSNEVLYLQDGDEIICLVPFDIDLEAFDLDVSER